MTSFLCGWSQDSATGLPSPTRRTGKWSNVWEWGGGSSGRPPMVLNMLQLIQYSSSNAAEMEGLWAYDGHIDQRNAGDSTIQREFISDDSIACYLKFIPPREWSAAFATRGEYTIKLASPSSGDSRGESGTFTLAILTCWVYDHAGHLKRYDGPTLLSSCHVDYVKRTYEAFIKFADKMALRYPGFDLASRARSVANSGSKSQANGVIEILSEILSASHYGHNKLIKVQTNISHDEDVRNFLGFAPVSGPAGVGIESSSGSCSGRIESRASNQLPMSWLQRLREEESATDSPNSGPITPVAPTPTPKGAPLTADKAFMRARNISKKRMSDSRIPAVIHKAYGKNGSSFPAPFTSQDGALEDAAIMALTPHASGSVTPGITPVATGMFGFSKNRPNAVRADARQSPKRASKENLCTQFVFPTRWRTHLLGLARSTSDTSSSLGDMGFTVELCEVELVQERFAVYHVALLYTLPGSSKKLGQKKEVMIKVRRRYSDFSKFAVYMSHKYPQFRILDSFPPKGYRLDLTPVFLEKRSKKLQHWLETLLSHKIRGTLINQDVEISADPVLRRFLGLPDLEWKLLPRMQRPRSATSVNGYDPTSGYYQAAARFEEFRLPENGRRSFRADSVGTSYDNSDERSSSSWTDGTEEQSSFSTWLKKMFGGGNKHSSPFANDGPGNRNMRSSSRATISH